MDTQNLLTETVTLPSGRTAKIRELTGREEDLLTDEKVVKSGRVVQQLLGNVLLELDGVKPTSTDVLDMWAADRTAVLLFVRTLSYGSEFETKHECENPECRTHFSVSADLPDDLEWTAPPEEFQQVIDLPGGASATIRPLKGRDEAKLLQARSKGELMTEMLFLRIEELHGIDGVDSRQSLRQFLKTGSSRIRREIRKGLGKTEFGYSETIHVTCPVCNQDQDVAVASSPDFFFPGEAEESTAR